MKRRMLLVSCVSVVIGFSACLLLVPRGTAPANADCPGTPDVPCGNGDVNGDGVLDISDAIYTLTYLFAGGAKPEPLEAPPCDTSCCPPVPPIDITGSYSEQSQAITLSWANPETYTAIEITRDGGAAVSLSGEEVTYVDSGVIAGQTYSYSVCGVVGEVRSASVTCVIITPSAYPPCDSCCPISSFTPGPLPATGQMTCFDDLSRPANVIPCDDPTYMGQDGFYQAGCPKLNRFVDNGDGTVTDSCTDLMWLKGTADIDQDGSITGPNDMLDWQDAHQYCESLQLEDHSDWRLPNSRELLSIVDYGLRDPAVDAVFNLEPSAYWSSTTSHWSLTGGPPDTAPPWDHARTVHFLDGTGPVDLKTELHFILAVRGTPRLPATGQVNCYDNADIVPCDQVPGQDGQYQAGCPGPGMARFIANGDGTVTDTCTGLVWQQDTPPATRSWKNALQYCESLILCIDGTWTTDPAVAGGHEGIKIDTWRLPNIRELESIIDYSRINSAIDPVFGTEPTWYWSSTNTAEVGDARLVHFDWGHLDADVKGKAHYVRAVRGPAPLITDFHLVPAGSFTMGQDGGDAYPYDGPAHDVTLTQSFYMAAHEVTQAQWEAIMGTNPSANSGCPDCPVENVSWDDVQAFITALCQREGVPAGTYRLPTEAEWEYACRAGTTTQYYWGNDPDVAYMWDGSNSNDQTHPVGQKLPNALGLYDMSGNVWEWCQDWYDESNANGGYSGNPDTDPVGPATGALRIARGGCYNCTSRDARSAARGRTPPATRQATLGFRLVRTSPP